MKSHLRPRTQTSPMDKAPSSFLGCRNKNCLELWSPRFKSNFEWNVLCPNSYFEVLALLQSTITLVNRLLRKILFQNDVIVCLDLI